jgi:hypothetical protein
MATTMSVAIGEQCASLEDLLVPTRRCSQQAGGQEPGRGLALRG